MLATSILQFGSDAILLQSRSPILAKAGGIVDSVQSLDEFAQCVETREFGLLILCHSISDEDRQRAIALGLQSNPAMQILALQAQNA